MNITAKSKLKALDLLKDYKGKNPYILLLQRDILCKNVELNDFSCEYILRNINFEPVQINKTIKIADWYQEKKKEDWCIDFLPEKLAIKCLIGETSNTYHCYVKYRKNMEPKQVFIPKKAVLNNFLVKDYNDITVDFDRYDKLSMSKNPLRKLREHQKSGVKFLLSRKKCILADDMGYGKTTTLSVAAIEGNFDSVLIICPASIKTNWKKELMWYIPDKDISIIDSIQDKNKKELESLLGYGIGKSGKTVQELKNEASENGKWQDNRFVIVNFDILDEFYNIPSGRSAKNVEEALKNSPLYHYLNNKKSLIIIDEVHRLSNTTSNRYKIIKDLIKRTNPDSIYTATGTPITNNPQNFYCVLQFLGDPITDDYNYYMERYCNSFKIPKKGEKEKWTEIFLKRKKIDSISKLDSKDRIDLKNFIKENAKMINVPGGPSNLDELQERVSHIYLRRVKEDLMDLPNKNVHEIRYEFTEQQKHEYDKLWDEYETTQYEINPNKEINKELIEGAIYRKYCSMQMIPNTISLAERLISEGKKVIIATCYDDEINTLKEYFGDRAVMYNGKMSIKQKDFAQKEFTENPNVMVFLGNIIAAGVGITLTVSQSVIYNNMSFVPGDNRQMEDRCYRIGQTKDVDIYYQMFRNTQYEKMWDIILKKELTINSIIKKESEKS